MDFITQLPSSQGYNKIIVAVDIFSKYAAFISTKVPCKVEDVAKLHFRHVVKYWELPLSIVSDKDT